MAQAVPIFSEPVNRPALEGSSWIASNSNRAARKGSTISATILVGVGVEPVGKPRLGAVGLVRDRQDTGRDALGRCPRGRIPQLLRPTGRDPPPGTGPAAPALRHDEARLQGVPPGAGAADPAPGAARRPPTRPLT